MEEDQPEHLLARMAAGDRAAVLELHDRFGPAMLAVALRVTRDRGAAEEVVQEVLVSVWRNATTFDRARGTAAAWLLTLTRNRAIDVVRSQRRRALHLQRSALDVASFTPSPEQLGDTSQRARAVRNALASLRPEQRQALELAYFQGLSHTEIAEALGAPLGTVKTRIAMAVRTLRDALQDLDGPGEP